MKKLFILLILISNYSFGQKMNNEAQDLIDLYLKSKDMTTNEYAVKHKLKSLYVLINNSMSRPYSKIDYDKKGKVVSYLLYGKRPISKKVFKYDKQNRVSEIRYFDKSEKFINGTYNIYRNDSIFTYSLKDSILTEINSSTKNRIVNILNFDNIIGVSHEKIINDEGKTTKEIFIENGLKRVKEYEYVDDSMFVTVTEFDSSNKEISKSKYLSEKKTDNKKKFYKKNKEKPYKIETYDKERLMSELYFDDNGNEYKEFVYHRLDNGTLNKMELLNHKTDKKIKYVFKTDSKGRLTEVGKKIKRDSFSYNFKFLIDE